MLLANDSQPSLQIRDGHDQLIPLGKHVSRIVLLNVLATKALLAS
jgi:hypothetical protein